MAKRIKKYLLGTAIKITVVLSVDTVEAITITVDDPSEVVKAGPVNMTKETDKVYSYVYQSDDEDQEGNYVFTINITDSGYNVVEQGNFTLIEQE